jgi:hypothetical protein
MACLGKDDVPVVKIIANKTDMHQPEVRRNSYNVTV